MAEETSVKILDIRKIPSSDPARVGKIDMIVTYQIDTFRTYMLTIPSEEFNEETLKKRIKAELGEMQQWINKEIKL